MDDTVWTICLPLAALSLLWKCTSHLDICLSIIRHWPSFQNPRGGWPPQDTSCTIPRHLHLHDLVWADSGIRQKWRLGHPAAHQAALFHLLQSRKYLKGLLQLALVSRHWCATLLPFVLDFEEATTEETQEGDPYHTTLYCLPNQVPSTYPLRLPAWGIEPDDRMWEQLPLPAILSNTDRRMFQLILHESVRWVCCEEGREHVSWDRFSIWAITSEMPVSPHADWSWNYCLREERCSGSASTLWFELSEDIFQHSSWQSLPWQLVAHPRFTPEANSIFLNRAHDIEYFSMQG